jgi:hypothetical protein
MEPRLASNLQSFFFSLPSAGITDVYHCAQPDPMQYFRKAAFSVHALTGLIHGLACVLLLILGKNCILKMLQSLSIRIKLQNKTKPLKYFELF